MQRHNGTAILCRWSPVPCWRNYPRRSRRRHADGFAVALLDNAAKAETIARELSPDGETAIGLRCDVTDQSAWASAADATRSLERVQVLVANAVTVRIAALHETSLESWQGQPGVMLTGTFLGVQTFLSKLRSTRGSIVLVSSVHTNSGLPGRPAYATAKAGLTGLGRQLAAEYGPDVWVNKVLPGPILTPLWDDIDEENRRKSATATALESLGAPVEIALVIAFLASRESSYVTGATIPVDGGWSITKDSP